MPGILIRSTPSFLSLLRAELLARMIVVTGTKRSGTSLWMQILAAGGVEVIGEAFPRNWEATIKDANPRGFYESKLIAGVYFGTNPDPETGTYLFPEQVRSHAVKIFIPGLIKTELGFIDRCIATVRPWTEYVASLTDLRAMAGAAEDLDESRQGSSSLLPVLEWWGETYSLVRDIATRRYPAHVQPYAKLIADPKRVLTEVFAWLGVGDATAALTAVEPALHRKRANALDVGRPSEVPDACFELFDDLYQAIHDGSSLTNAFIERLNRGHEQLRPLFLEHQLRSHGSFLRDLAQHPESPLRTGTS